MYRFRHRLAAARAADAAELGQALLRLSMVPMVGMYFAVTFLWDRALDDHELAVFAVVAAAFVLGVAHFAWILTRPGVNHARRLAGVLLDMATVTGGMALGEEPGAALFGLYLWVVVGNGFRFGRWYLHYAQVLSVVGFAIVLAASEFWREHSTLAATVMVVLVAIPWYVSVLVVRLHAATDRLQAARGAAESANEAKTRFIAAASHDLRQPMQALSMYASVLEARLTDADALRLVHGVQLSVKTLEQMFDSLLDISKIESGVVKPRLVSFPVQPLIDQVVEAERPIAARKRLELRVVRCSASVKSDPALLERMLKNLLTNAIRYTERGGIVVGCRRLAGGRLRLEVLDSGIGIPSSEHERIFDEYYQVGSAGAQGLGLGLPIVRSLGALLGHAVSVRSTPGRGSAFAIELDTAPDEPAAPRPPEAPSATLRSVNVVLVDDDVEVRESMRLLIESWGCRCIAGASAADVQAKLAAGRVAPDALIVDFRLAGPGTGIDVIERVRATYGRELPALLITGEPISLQNLPNGIPYAVKPVPPGKLRAFLSHARKT